MACGSGMQFQPKICPWRASDSPGNGNWDIGQHSKVFSVQLDKEEQKQQPWSWVCPGRTAAFGAQSSFEDADCAAWTLRAQLQEADLAELQERGVESLRLLQTLTLARIPFGVRVQWKLWHTHGHAGGIRSLPFNLQPPSPTLSVVVYPKPCTTSLTGKASSKSQTGLLNSDSSPHSSSFDNSFWGTLFHFSVWCSVSVICLIEIRGAISKLL